LCASAHPLALARAVKASRALSLISIRQHGQQPTLTGDVLVKRKQERYAVAVSGKSPLGVTHNKALPNRAPARLTKLPPAEVTGVAEMALPRQPAL
jgi:hypothetical protein